jgi:MFS family permease
VISSKERGLYMGVQQTFGGMARVIFPILFGFLYDRSSGLPFLVSAALVLFTVYLGVGMDSYARTDAKAAAA